MLLVRLALPVLLARFDLGLHEIPVDDVISHFGREFTILSLENAMHPYINLFGRNIGTYGLCMVAGFSLAVLLSLQKGKPKGLTMEDLLIVGAFALGFALLGGSLLYVFVTYSLVQIWEFVQQGNFDFLSGGIVFYGGLIGGAAGALVGIRVAGCKFELIERSVVPFIPLGHAVGRIGCVMAGCCYGFAYDGPFALHYPNAASGLSPDQGYFPVQPLEALINVGICLFLLRYEKKMKRATNLLFAYLGLYAVSRFFLEMLRGDEIRGAWHTVSTSQIISILLLIVSIVGFCWGKRSKAEM